MGSDFVQTKLNRPPLLEKVYTVNSVIVYRYLFHLRVTVPGHSSREFSSLGSAPPSRVTELWRDCTNAAVVDASNSSCN